MRREKTIALLVGTCMILALCMTSFVTTADAVTIIEETGSITQGEFYPHYINIPAGPEVMIELYWEDPPRDAAHDLDFYELGWTVAGASWSNPEVAFLSDITAPMVLGIGVHGYYVGADSVDYTLVVTVGSDVIPDPYAEPGGLSVGALTSWLESSRNGTRLS